MERVVQAEPRVVVLTGMSGAGLSTAMHTLEDLGYETVDNVPLALLDAVALYGAAPEHPLAIGINSRTRDFSAEAVLQRLETLRARLGDSAGLSLVFLDCEDDVLQRRYTETRRRHPQAAELSVRDGIAAERGMVSRLRDEADLALDTTTLSVHNLRRILSGHYALGRSAGLQVFVTSFSYRAGLPREADLVFDVRFLRNPHYEAALKPLTGLDSAVRDYIQADDDFVPFFERLTAFLALVLPRYENEGKSYLTIAIGCTGGKHRSVFVAERLARWLSEMGTQTQAHHRDVPVAAALSSSGS